VRRAAPLAVLLFAACSGDNGLPADVIALLAEKGVTVKPMASKAPFAKRSGWVEATPAPLLIDRITAGLGLPECRPDDPALRAMLARADVDVAIDKAFAIAGRPPTLRLGNGGQFEFLCLVLGKDKRLLLVAEYASG
jgi:hypothetical protein